MDITVHEVSDEHGHILEKDCPSGGLFGGIHVDQEFENLMSNAFGEDFIRKFREDFPNDWQVIMNNFEIQKRAEEDIDNDEISFYLPLNFYLTCVQETGDKDINNKIRRSYRDKVKVSSGYLIITMETLRDLYRPIVTKIADHIHDLLAKDSLQDVNTMFFVGGFSEAQFLRKEISHRFENKRILVPQDPQLAIIYGAVQFAQDPTLLRARVMGKTYGMETCLTFDPDKHPQEKRVETPHSTLCSDIFKTLVKKNERIDLEETRSFLFTPIFDDATYVTFKFYSTNHESAKFTTDPGVESEGVIVRLPSPDTTKGINREILLEVKFGGTELKATCTDVESGNICAASIELVSRPVFHSCVQ